MHRTLESSSSAVPSNISVTRLKPALTVEFLNRLYRQTGQSDTHADIQLVLGEMLSDALVRANNAEANGVSGDPATATRDSYNRMQQTTSARRE